MCNTASSSFTYHKLCAATWGDANPPHIRAHSSLFTPIIMYLETTLPYEEAPLSSEETEPSEEEPTESVEELKERLAAAEEEALRWKNRVAEENPKKKKNDSPKLDVTEKDIDWKIENANRISLVKEAYDKELQDLEDSGVTLTNSIRDKALNYAESTTGVTKNPVSEPFPVAGIDRTEGSMPSLTEYDRAMNVKPEVKEKYREYVEGI